MGGLGRRDCAPYSDLDLVLLHNGTAGIDRIASGLWYPIWDARLGLDHSVRTMPEALSVAHDDVKVALGLLDARHVAGDAALSGELIAAAGDQWRRTAVRLMPQLKELTTSRWASHGELAFLLEGDLKEAAGGLRDVTILRGIGRAGVADTMRPAVRAADLRLLDTRDALHLAVGRRVDRLVAQERAAVAELLELDDGDALLRRVAGDARTVAHAVDDAWRAADRLRNGRRRGGLPPAPAGTVAARSPGTWSNRTASWCSRAPPSARSRTPACRCGWPPRPPPCGCRSPGPPASGSPPSARRCPRPWPPAARAALVSLLGSGPGLLPTWEACDRYGLIDAWLPEWARMRSLPQHHPVHRFTLDRHLVQAAYEATAYAREVDRPDLLLIGAFLHDVGKGLPGDHSLVGAPIAGEIAARIGLPPADVATVEKLVRLHLLLPDVATRRDLSDPVTISTVAGQVGDAATLDLLHALARADSHATGPAAWSDWKGRLIAELVRRVHTALDTGELPEPPAPDPELLDGALPAVHLDGDRIAVAAADRRGLLGAVAACLAMHRLDVVGANAGAVDGRAIVEFFTQPRYGSPYDPVALAADLRRVAAGDVSVTQRVRARAMSARGGTASPKVVWQRDAATDAAVLELRAADSAGLLYRVATALDEAGAEVRAARISTLGGDVVDAFYLVGSWADAGERARVESAVLAAV